ncbi:hypothetical protein BB987_17580 [Photorhabdus temperata]|nr:hypothetical protein BB987_17580 [Photorhabdus temperata]
MTDKLRGRKFNNFDDFRKAFLKEVGNDTELSKQFRKTNQEDMKNGLSPYPPKLEQVGGRQKYDIHHVKFIKDDGSVYELDNL